MRHSVHQIEKSSFDHVAAIVEQARGNNDNFGTSHLTGEMQINLTNHDTVTFPEGTVVSFYGSRAVLLATLRSSEHALTIQHDSSAELYSHAEPSVDELVAKRDVFIEWMEASWNTPSNQ